MSRGTLTAIAGAAIGFMVGGPLGAKIGWTVGSFLGAPSQPNQVGPRLDDLQAESIDYGTAKPICYGRVRVAGFRFWQRNIREQANKEKGGKGGSSGSVTTFTYFGTWAISLGDMEIAAVRKIWADSRLIYNVGATSDLETIIASNNAAKGIRIYYGTETQMPDSLIQATDGVANTPAYRGTPYIVFHDMALEKYGNRIPNITVELITDATLAVALKVDTIPNQTHYTSAVSALYCGQGDDSVTFAVTSNNIQNTSASTSNSFDVSRIDVTGVATLLFTVNTYDWDSNYRNWDWTQGYSDQPAVLIRHLTASLRQFAIYTFDNQGVTGFSTYKQQEATSGNQEKTVVIKNRIIYLMAHTTKSVEVHPIAINDPAFPNQMTTLIKNDDFVKVYAMQVDDDNIYLLDGISSTQVRTYIYTTGGEFVDSFVSDVAGITGGLALNAVAFFVKDGFFWVHTGTSLYKYQKGSSITTYTIPAGAVSFGGQALVGDTLIVYARSTGTFDVDMKYRAWHLGSVTSGSIPLSLIVSDLSDRAGVKSTQYDVTELIDIVEGYSVGTQMSARAAIDPLRRAYLFDASEIGGKLKFIKRGKAAILEITSDDLGANTGENQLKQTRQQDSELPSQVSIGYISAVRDYEPASQLSQRINFNVINNTQVELPIVLSDDRAIQLADIALYNSYVEREKFEFSLLDDFIALNPTDVITLNHEGLIRTLRIEKASYADAIQIEAVSDDPLVYESEATASEEDNFTGQTVGLVGPTNLQVLDIPLLRNQDNDFGLYYAATGLFDGWPGAQIFKSLDGGITFSSLEATFNDASIGRATTILPDVEPTVWDRATVLNVAFQGGNISSTTEGGATQGVNTLLCGNEIIAFVDAELQANGSYNLSTLIRGLRGTEWAIAGHVASEVCVLLNEDDLGRFDSILSAERVYRGVTIGANIDSADNVTKLYSGVNFKPFSVAYTGGSRDGSNNLTITWKRRSRAISQLFWTPPLLEETESYEVDIMDGATVLRTIEVSAQTASYTAAQQTTDGLTPGDAVTVRVYQISGTVGRGYVSEEII